MDATKSNGVGRQYLCLVRWLGNSFGVHFEGTNMKFLLLWKGSLFNGFTKRYPTKLGWNGQLQPLVWLQCYCLLLGYFRHIPIYGDGEEGLSVLVSILRGGSWDLAFGLTLNLLKIFSS